MLTEDRSSSTIVAQMFSKLNLAALLAFYAVFPTAAAAEQYWAAPSGVRCTSADCQCTLISPCQLSQRLYQTLRPGDVLTLQPGTYSAQKLEYVKGSEAFPIVIAGTRKRPTDQAATGDLLRETDYLSTVTADGFKQHRDAFELFKSSHVIVRDLLIRGALRSGMRVNNSHHVSIEHNWISNNGVWGIFTNHSNATTVRGNRILGPAEQHGVYFSNSGDGGQIAENFIADFEACGIQLNGDLSMGGSDGVAGDGIIEDVVIERNFISGSGLVGGSAINLDGASNTLVRSNLLLANRSAAIAAFRSDGAEPTVATRIIDNVIVGARESRSPIIFARGSEQHLVQGNTILALNPKTALISIDGLDEPNLFERLSGVHPIPSEFLSNRYAHLGPMARFGEHKVWRTYDDWRRVAGEEASELLDIELQLLEDPDPLPLYRELYRRLIDSGSTIHAGHLKLLLEPKTPR